MSAALDIGGRNSVSSFLPSLARNGRNFSSPPAHPPPPFLFLPLFPGCPIKACVEVGGEGRRGGKNESQGEEGELSSPSSIRRSSFSRIMMREIFLIQRPCTKSMRCPAVAKYCNRFFVNFLVISGDKKRANINLPLCALHKVHSSLFFPEKKCPYVHKLREAE